MLNEAQKDNLIDLLGEKLHAEALKQADEIVYGASYVEDTVGGCRVDSEVNFYGLASVAVEFMDTFHDGNA